MNFGYKGCFGWTTTIIMLLLGCSSNWLPTTSGFSAALFSSSSGIIGTPGSDRFRVTCPADVTNIRPFFTNLPEPDDDDESCCCWVAVYRSNQNQPSVLVRDDFFRAMTDATKPTDDEQQQPDNNNNNNDNNNNKLETPMMMAALEKPVAVARLRPTTSENERGVLLLDQWRCSLKKELMDEDCDGGSEYLEALGVALDGLLLHHLQQQKQQQQQQLQEDDDDQDKEKDKSTTTPKSSGSSCCIRIKGTLYSQSLLKERGMEPIESLSQDMAIHQFTLQCFEDYSQRAMNAVSPGARYRALQMVSLMTLLQQEEQDDASSSSSIINENDDDDDDDEYDPWANIKMQL